MARGFTTTAQPASDSLPAASRATTTGVASAGTSSGTANSATRWPEAPLGCGKPGVEAISHAHAVALGRLGHPVGHRPRAALGDVGEPGLHGEARRLDVDRERQVVHGFVPREGPAPGPVAHLDAHDRLAAHLAQAFGGERQLHLVAHAHAPGHQVARVVLLEQDLLPVGRAPARRAGRAGPTPRRRAPGRASARCGRAAAPRGGRHAGRVTLGTDPERRAPQGQQQKKQQDEPTRRVHGPPPKNRPNDGSLPHGRGASRRPLAALFRCVGRGAGAPYHAPRPGVGRTCQPWPPRHREGGPHDPAAPHRPAPPR